MKKEKIPAANGHPMFVIHAVKIAAIFLLEKIQSGNDVLQIDFRMDNGDVGKIVMVFKGIIENQKKFKMIELKTPAEKGKA